jgi:hypothetical protein
MQAIQMKKCMATMSVLLFIVPLGTYAADRGIPDSRMHQFAGYLGAPNQEEAVNSGCPSEVVYFSCGGYLVDVQSIGLPKSLDRRIFVTAGHCVDKYDNQKSFVIHFNDGDARVVNQSCRRVVDFKPSGSGFNYYYGTRLWTLFATQALGVGVGVAKLDYALILLDKPVAVSDVNKAAKIAYTNSTNLLTPSTIPVLGMAGFGVAGFGNLNQRNALGQPLLINGPREKMYVEMPTRSVQKTNILSEMNAAQADQTACNGDSGSALFTPVPDQYGFYNVYGHVSAGDYYCRATNTSTRVDTQEFRDFVNRVSQEIVDAAR